jgi:UDP-N-acetylglucosamine 4,6-dehydratase/5-epimerase
MQGGEIFVPKIPSVRILDLVQAMAPGSDIDIIGIRPGEKLHEIMCPLDLSHNTIEFSDHYVIAPSIAFNQPMDYLRNNLLGELGEPVASSFEYHSGNNPHFLNIEELRELNIRCCA